MIATHYTKTALISLLKSSQAFKTLTANDQFLIQKKIKENDKPALEYIYFTLIRERDLYEANCQKLSKGLTKVATEAAFVVSNMKKQ